MELAPVGDSRFQDIGGSGQGVERIGAKAFGIIAYFFSKWREPVWVSSENPIAGAI
jgi:hypothetical protein